MKTEQLKSEVLKFFSHKWILLTIFALGIFLPAMAQVLDPMPGTAEGEVVAARLIQSFYLGQVGFLVLTALYFGQEFTKGSLRTSLLSVPSRGRFLCVKFLNLILWEVILHVLYGLISAVVVRAGAGLPITAESVFRLGKLLVPAGISTIQLSLMEASLVVIFGSMTIPLAMTASMILGLGQLLHSLGAWAKYLPVLSVMNGFSTVFVPVYPEIRTGLLIQLGWSVLFLLLSYLALGRKSVR